jgi:hypothetical protein
MSVSIDTSWFQEYLIIILEPFFKKLFFWETDPVRIGKLIRFLHHSIVYIIGISIILVHTVIPSYFLLCIVYLACVLIWIQHITTGGCLSSKLEQRLIGDKTSFVDPILEVFNIPITPQTTSGIVVMGSTLVIFMLSLELCARTVLTLNSYLRF